MWPFILDCFDVCPVWLTPCAGMWLWWQAVAVRLMKEVGNSSSPRRLHWATVPTKHQLLSEFNFPRSYWPLLQMPNEVRRLSGRPPGGCSCNRQQRGGCSM
jgi:hypothetical protein